MVDSIVKFAQYVSNGVLNFITNEGVVLKIIKVGFIFIMIMFLLLGIQTGINVYHNNVKQFIGGGIGLVLSFIGLCFLITIIHQMSKIIKQEKLDIIRNDSGEDYIEVSCENHDPNGRNVYTIGGWHANVYQFGKLDQFVDYIKQKSYKIGKYVVDRQNNTFKKIDMEE